MEAWILNKVYNLSKKHFTKWYGICFGICLILVIFLVLYSLIPEGFMPFMTWMYISLVFSLLLITYWIFDVFYMPKRTRDKLGVVISVQVDNHEDLRHLQKDFLQKFKVNVVDFNLPIDTIILKPHQAERINSIEDAKRLLKKTKSQFCIWGSIKRRKNGFNSEKYIFSLRGIVVHKVIEEVQQILLQNEFSELLPPRISFEENIQFEAFEFRANQVFIAVNYITGRVALLSGDFNTAITLHKPLFEAIERGENLPIAKSLLEKLLSIEHYMRAINVYLEKGITEEYKLNINESLKYNKKSYGALLNKSILEFNDGEGDAEKALDTIENAKKYSHGGLEWLYSKVFLLFWLENYNKALKYCKNLRKQSYNGENETIEQVCKFNNDLIIKYTHKPQLLYWMGFIHYFKTRNIALADKYFQEFINSADSSMEILKARAQTYLSQIKNQIGYE